MMTEMTVTEFARKLRAIFDRIEHGGEEVVLIRNRHPIARIVPGTPWLTAQEAMGDLYGTLPEDAARDWVKDSRTSATVGEETRDPWA
jgi:antitoxin (DNA-binding transcriptional repressor) of toxin-antitoxin stability system